MSTSLVPLQTMSKDELASKVRGLLASRSRAERDGESIRQALYTSLGAGSAFATGALLGLVEGRVRNKDGTPCSLGPIPLPLAAAIPLVLVSWFFDPARQVSAAAAGATGLLGGTMGRGWGTAWRARGGAEKVGAEDALTAAEQEIVFG